MRLNVALSIECFAGTRSSFQGILCHVTPTVRKFFPVRFTLPQEGSHAAPAGGAEKAGGLGLQPAPNRVDP